MPTLRISTSDSSLIGRRPRARGILRDEPQPPRVLIVDDNAANLAAFEATLADEGFRVVTAQSGADAMRHLLGGDFAVILLDINMPRLGGIETAHLIRQRERSRGIPIIFITAYQPDQAQLLDGYASGGADYLVKPVQPEILRSKVRIFVELYRKTRQVEAQALALRAMNERLRAEVAQRKNAERDAAFEREERQRVTLNSIADAVITTDADARVIALNPAAEQLVGWQADAARGIPVGRLLPMAPEPGRPSIDEVLRTAVAGGETVRIDRSASVETREHGRRFVEYAVAPVRDRIGTVIGTVVIVHDVTDRHAIELERVRALRLEKTARRAAEQAGRMRDEFLAVISHELRAPLNAIVGWTEILRLQSSPGAHLRRATESIHRSAMAQKKLIEDLLDMSRIINGKMELSMQPVDLLAAVEAALGTLRPEAQAKSVRIEPVRADACTVIGDAARLDQIIANVLGNAVKFTGTGGTVEVALACEGAEAVLTVADSGEGIAADFLPHVFESFRQADSTSTRRQGGLGLGLAIARRLVQLHGGTIAAESEGIGRGARITIRLPIGGPPAEVHPLAPTESSAVAASADETACPLARLRLLIVDDDPDTLEMVSILARGAGAEVKAASSVREALQLVREWAPDALLSDISMPGEDGYDLIRRVRALPAAEGGSVVAAALTAMATGADRARALESGYQAHIAKPIDFPALVATLVALVRNADSRDCPVSRASPPLVPRVSSPSILDDPRDPS